MFPHFSYEIFDEAFLFSFFFFGGGGVFHCLVGVEWRTLERFEIHNI